MSDALCHLTIAELAPKLAARELSPVELTRAYLDRIGRLDGALHTFSLVTTDRALADARAAEEEIGRGSYRGPLHGIPIGLKDLYDTAGIATTGSSHAYLDRVPTEDGVVSAKLRAAGTVLLGKQTMHELATGIPDTLGPFPRVRNPWNLDRMPAGSSSGSGAAVAAHLSVATMGSDTGGSIRSPAAWCGVVGHKPTYGLVSRRGVMPLSWTLDHAGPLTRTVEDTAIMLQAVAGFDPLDDGSADVLIPDYRAALAEPVTGLRVGVPWGYLESLAEIEADTMAAFRAAVDGLSSLGANVRPIELPFMEHIGAIQDGILVSEAYAFHEAGLRANPELYGRPFKERIVRGALWSAADYVQAMRGRTVFRRGMAAAMADLDIVAMPTSSRAAGAFDDPSAVTYNRPSFTRLFNITGQPSISVPCGFTSENLPVGLMLSGRPFEDATVLRLAHAYERARDWYQQHPPDPA